MAETTTETPTPRKKRRPRKKPEIEVQDFDEGNEDEEEEEEIYSAPPIPRQTKAQKRLAEEEHEDIATWLRGLGNLSGYEAKIFRVEPKHYDGDEIAGYIASEADILEITEEYLKQRFGGGTYRIQLHGADAHGRQTFVRGGQRLVKVSGPPIIASKNANGHEENPTVAGEALNMVKDLMRNNNNRNGSGDVGPMLMSVLQLMQDTNNSSKNEIRELMSQMFEMNKPAPSKSDELLGQMLNKESAQIAQLTANHQSELRQIKESHRDEVKRLEDRYERQISDLQRRNDAVIEDLKRTRDYELQRIADSGKSEIKHLERGHTMYIDSLKRDVTRLEADLVALRAENATLKAKKDQSLPEKMTEIASVAESLKLMGLHGNDEEPKGRFDKFLDAVTSPAVLDRVANRFRPESEGGQQQLQGPQVTPIGPAFDAATMGGPAGVMYTPMQDPQGNVFLQDPNGQLHQLSPNDAEQLKQQLSIHQAQAEADHAASRGPTNEELKMASTYVENALGSGTDPEMFAMTAKAALEGPMIRWIINTPEDQIIERFLQVDRNSRLGSQRGRDFVRKVRESLNA